MMKQKEDDKKDYIFTYKNMILKKIGNTYNLFIGDATRPIMTLGPDYLYSAFMLLFILFAGSITYWFIISISPFTRIRKIWKISYILSLINYALVVLKNQNIVLEKRVSGSEMKTCEKCDAIQVDDKTSHCKFCNVCVKGFDHHCMVVSKCISRGNVVFFYLFVVFIVIAYMLDLMMIFHFFYITFIKKMI